jgi:hypothetical protein
LQCEVFFGGGVLWGLLKLPSHCLCFLISLQVRLWVGLCVRVAFVWPWWWVWRISCFLRILG